MSTIVSNSNLVNGLEKRPSMSELGAQVASRANAMMASRSNVNVINITMESTQTNKRTASTNTTINNGHMAENIVVSESTTAVSAVSALASSTTAAIVGDNVANNANNISINNIVMSNLPSSRISYVRRGSFYGALFDADHLATFPVGPKSGVMRAEDGIRKLRAMEKSQGIWRMECQLMIDARNVVVFDKKTGQEVEVFPIELVSDPTSVMSDDEQKDAAYTNIILFTVLEDHHPQRRRLRTNPTEMHLFQCARDVDSADMVDEIYKVKERKMIGDMDQQQQQQQPRPDQIMSQQATNLNSYTVTNIEHSRSLYRPVPQQQMQQMQQMPTPSSHHLQSTYPPQNMASENGYRKLIIPTQSADVNNNGGLMRHRATLMGAVVSQSPVPQPQPQNHYQSNSVIPKPPQSVDFYPPPPAPHPSSAHHLHNHQPLSLPPPAPHTMSQFQQHQQMSANRVEMEVQVLNHCFDDIECFVSRLQASIEVVRELEKRHLKQTQKGKNLTKSKKLKLIADEMQAIRAQLPQSHAFVDIFQKFKLSFNLLARLKLHIHNPNAPELVHVLFEPLATIVNAVNKELAWLIDTTEVAASVTSTSVSALGKNESGQPPITTTAGFTGSSSLKAMVKNVWSPMLTRDAKELMLNTLGSKEQDLWFTLGDAWMVSREEAKLQPHLYSANIDFNQHYAPVFYDGWAPNLSALAPSHAPEAYSVSYPSSYLPAQQQQPTAQDFSRLAYSAAAAAAHQPQSVLKYGGARSSVDAGQSMNSTNNMPPPPPPNATSQQKRINFAVVDESTLSYNNYSSSRPLGNNNNNTTANTTNNRTRNGQNESNASTFSSSNKQPAQPQVPPQVSIRNYEEMKKWAVDLAYRGAKVYEVVQNRQANNDKELTIKSGELLEVLDDKRNWWKVRNFYGNTGYAPVTILRPFDLSSAMN